MANICTQWLISVRQIHCFWLEISFSSPFPPAEIEGLRPVMDPVTSYYPGQFNCTASGPASHLISLCQDSGLASISVFLHGEYILNFSGQAPEKGSLAGLLGLFPPAVTHWWGIIAIEIIGWIFQPEFESSKLDPSQAFYVCELGSRHHEFKIGVLDNTRKPHSWYAKEHSSFKGRIVR